MISALCSCNHISFLSSVSEISLDRQWAVVSCAGFGTRLHRGCLDRGLLLHVGAPGFAGGWQAGPSACGGHHSKEISPTFCVRQMRVIHLRLLDLVILQDPNTSSHKISVT